MVVDATKVVVDHTMTSWRDKLSDVEDFGIVRSTAEGRLCVKDKQKRHTNSHRYAAIISDAAERLKEYKDVCKMWVADEDKDVIKQCEDALQKGSVVICEGFVVEHVLYGSGVKAGWWGRALHDVIDNVHRKVTTEDLALQIQ